jgi:hypothetical protein
MIVRFLRKEGSASWLVDVSRDNPLPVDVRSGDGSSLPIELISLDVLLVVSTVVDATSNRDLFGNTNTELPTLDGCGQYRKLIWFYFRTGAENTSYRILARVTDISGTPLGSGWHEIVSAGTLSGVSNSWGRVEIPVAGDGYYDQYRIEVRRTEGSNYVLTSKIVGVR